MRKSKNRILPLRKWLVLDGVIMAACLFLDQLTKYLVTERLKGGPALVLIDGVLELQYFENTGMAFSLFQNRQLFIVLMGLAVLGVLIFFLLRLPENRKFRIAHILLAMLIAGALGNLIDRFRLNFVVDFISFVLINYPIFNVADCFIVVSTVLIFLLFLFVYREEDLEFLSLRKRKAGEKEKEEGEEREDINSLKENH